ncbi:MAG: helix-turn-helix transcriptional regulator [Oceanococcus sp.]|nr:MAG: helix-turn-helix transcriptional regulator [Oceanococcus sp.]
MQTLASAQAFQARRSSFDSLELDDGEYPIGQAQLDRLLGAIYDGLNESPPWQGALEMLRETLNAAHVTLMLRPPSQESTGVMINTGVVDDSATESYEQRFFAVDPFVGLPPGEVVSADELMGKDQWRKSTMYQEYLKPLDIGYLLGADITTKDGIECRLRVTRAQDQQGFSENDKMICRVLLPHMERAIRLHARLDTLECERQLYSGAVNRLLLGIAYFNHEGSIVHLNDEAQRILADRDGVSRSGKGLAASSRSENQELQRLITEAVSGSVTETGPGLAEAMSVTRPSGRSQIGIVVRSIPFGEFSESKHRPAAVVYLRDPDTSPAQPSQEVVRRVFGLTRMEANLAILLAEGNTLDEAAEKLNVRRNTARTHLRSIFGKTGVTRQTMLVRMLLNSVVSLA